MKDYKKENIFTIPNVLTTIRILLIIPFIISFINEQYIILFAIVVLSALTDMADGMIARKFNQQTKLGAVLDPIADKLSLLAIVVCCVIKIPVIWPLVMIMILKELIMLAGGAFLIKKELEVPPAKWYGKVATVVFYASVIILVIVYIVSGTINNNVALIFMIINTVFMLNSLIRYALVFFDIIKNSKAK